MTTTIKIPFLDLITAHRELREELLAVVEEVLNTAGFIGGPMLESFERGFAQFCNAKYCVGVNSGTDALRFAFLAVGIKPGDIVITVPNTFIATSEAISQVGAQIAFVDIHEMTYTMAPQNLREYLETRCEFDRTRRRTLEKKSGRPVTAVVPVHLYGQSADMDPILELAEHYNLVVIEDACQAHGAEYFSSREGLWKKAGTMGRAAAFSFYPGKNLGACGEAGAITTDDEGLAQRMKMIRDHGQARKYYHEIEGYNGRLDAIQAGWLTVKLRHLSKWNDLRRALAHRYHKLLAEFKTGIIIPKEAPWAKGVYHLYVVRVEDREGLQAHLTAAGIGTGIHYPIPLHQQKAYEHLGLKMGDFPVTELSARQIVSLPMFPQLSHRHQDQVVGEIAEFLNARVASTS